MTIAGIVVNKKTYKRFQKIPSKESILPHGIIGGHFWNSIRAHVDLDCWNSVRIYSKPYLRGMRICYTEKQLREVLGD